MAQIDSQLEDGESRIRIQAVGDRIDDFEFGEGLELLNVLRNTVSAETSDATTST